MTKTTVPELSGIYDNSRPLVTVKDWDGNGGKLSVAEQAHAWIGVITYSKGKCRFSLIVKYKMKGEKVLLLLSGGVTGTINVAVLMNSLQFLGPVYTMDHEVGP